MWLGAVLPLIVVLALAPSSPALADTALVISGPSPYASCHTAGGDTLYLNAETAPSIAVNPATVGTDHVNLITVWEQDRWQAINAHGLVAGHSFDGGKTWAESAIPLGTCANPVDPYDRVSQPWVSIGPDGTAYVAGGGTKPDANAIWVTTSHDGGKTWGNVNMVTENAASTKLYANRPMVTADPTKPGVAYIIWERNLTTDNGPLTIWMAETTDAGKTWTKPAVLVDEPNWTGAFESPLQIDSHSGALYEAYWLAKPATVKKKTCKTVKKKGKKKVCSTKSVVPANPTKFNDAIAFTKSTDGGQTWSATASVHPLTPVSGTLPGVVVQTPLTSAIDPASGKLYVAFLDGSLSGGQTIEISLISSADGGATWSSPTRLSGSPGATAFLPVLAVNSAGVVGATYDDFRSGKGNVASLSADVWFTESTDGGAHFGSEQHLGGPYDLGAAPFINIGTGSAAFIGDYQGLTAVGTRFQAAFVGVNANSASNPTDILTASINP